MQIERLVQQVIEDSGLRHWDHGTCLMRSWTPSLMDRHAMYHSKSSKVGFARPVFLYTPVHSHLKYTVKIPGSTSSPSFN